MTNPFDRLDPRDGYRVTECNQGELEISLHVGLYGDGDLQDAFDGDPQNATQEIWQCKLPEATDHGTRARVRLAMEAICRYFNSGGTWEELEDVQRLARPVVRGLHLDGWHYFDGYIDTDSNFTHIWVSDVGGMVRWVEGEYIDTNLTLADLERELEEDDTEEAIHHQPAASGSEGAGEETLDDGAVT